MDIQSLEEFEQDFKLNQKIFDEFKQVEPPVAKKKKSRMQLP